MKFFSIGIWALGGLIALLGFLVLLISSLFANKPIENISYVLLIISLVFFYMAWSEFKTFKASKNKKNHSSSIKFSPLNWINRILSLGYLFYSNFINNR